MKATKADGTPTGDPVDEEIFKQEISAYVKTRTKIKSNRQNAFSLIWGQCSDAIRARIESETGYEAMVEDADLVTLLKKIQTVMFNFQTHKYKPLAVFESKLRSMRFRQQPNQPLSEYYNYFKKYVEVTEHIGGSYGLDDRLVEAELPTGTTVQAATTAQMNAAAAKARDRYLTTIFLYNADRARYGEYWRGLKNQYTTQQDSSVYPATVDAAYTALLSYVPPKPSPVPTVRGHPVETALTTVGTATDPVPGDDGRVYPDITCYRCDRRGHYRDHCPSQPSNVQFLLDAHADGDFDDLSQFSFMNYAMVGTPSRIPDSWILLDNQSTVDMFSNADLLTNIRRTPQTMTVQCNAGVATTNLIADLPGYPNPVWYLAEGVANILSFSKVASVFPITYDSTNDRFSMHKPDGKIRHFNRSDKGLYYYDTKRSGSHTSESEQDTHADDEYVFVTTVADKKSNYAMSDYRMAEMARKIHNIIGRPSHKDFLRIVDNNLLLNCPITPKDVLAAEDIFGPNLGSLKGKTVRRSHATTDTPTVAIPPAIYERYKNVTLAIDIMFVNKIPFLVTISLGIGFGTVQHLRSQTNCTGSRIPT